MGDYSNILCYNRTLLAKAVDVIEKNIENTKFDINAFANEMCLGRTNLYYKIKGVTGLSPNEFITNKRLEKSLEILRLDSDITIAEVAYKSGFNNPSYFNRRFKSLFGITPKEYQKEYIRQI